MESERVRALHYSVQWVDQHPLSWDEAAFPATYEACGWDLVLSEKRLDASPSTTLTVNEARSQLAPLLAAWAASVEVEHRLIVTFFYLGADVERAEDRGRVTVADFAGSSDEATAAIRRGAPPVPNWSFQDTDTTSLARTLCLRPMRNGTRPVADAAYWLATHLESWAGSTSAVATRLNVSSAYFGMAKKWGARSDERKVSPNSMALTEGDKASLKVVLEELIRRLHLVESGLPPGDWLDVGDWPGRG
ncbi:hypothetical protein [Streptacidiphilus melanogenes]|uniref:hypothetical protein n=1 Tax=Streptacidiphilus melanogenes TaxID=411235 RepID=UPI0005AB460F|nr:hypothetical protein [Streptacidiphilus melanogenes]